jgi:hypothetical protein
VATLVVINANEAMVAPVVERGGVCVWWGSGVWRPVLCWCVWQESGFSCREGVFTFNLLKNKFYRLNFVFTMRFEKIMLQ